MAEPPPQSDTRRIPRWAWMSGIVAALVVLLVVVVMLTGGGHPRPSHGSDGDTPDSSRTAQMPDGHTPPEGIHQ